MSKIIGGLVSYEDGVKTVPGDNFSPTRKVRVELNFSLDDGDVGDKEIADVLDKAQAFVNGKLNLAVPTAAAKAVTVAPKPEAPKVAPVASKEPTGKDKLAAAAGLPADELTAAPKVSAPPRKAKKAEPDPDELTTAADPSDDISDLLGEQPKEITDADLNDLVPKTNGRVNTSENPGGVRIRKIVAEFIADKTKQPILRDIPQASRAAFVAKLEELK